MILYDNKKAMYCSLNNDTIFFGIVARVLQGNILAPYWFKICLDYALRTSRDVMKENGFTLKKQEASDIPQKR